MMPIYLALTRAAVMAITDGVGALVMLAPRKQSF
jgi:hypothetical protein